MSPLAALLTDLVDLGVEVAIRTVRVAYRPNALVTDVLAARIGEHRDVLFELLRSSPGYSLAELAIMARGGASSADIATINKVKTAFAAMGLMVTEFTPTPPVPPTPEPAMPAASPAATTPPSAPAPMTAEQLPPDWREMFEERAGIMEFDANLPRDVAERLALRDVLALMDGSPRLRAATGAMEIR
ncbi:MAG: hypothetical protein ACKVW3_09380 [Phycisphaerales bacterium]